MCGLVVSGLGMDQPESKYSIWLNTRFGGRGEGEARDSLDSDHSFVSRDVILRAG